MFSLGQPFCNNDYKDRKKIWTVANIIKRFCIIYANSGVFHEHFDWGYDDTDVITLKKVL